MGESGAAGVRGQAMDDPPLSTTIAIIGTGGGSREQPSS